MSQPPPPGPPDPDRPPSPWEQPTSGPEPPPPPPPPPGYDPNQPPHGYDPNQPPYGQPPGGQPYGQQWGSPYGPYGPPPSANRGVNVLAILSLVFAFVFPPAGIVLGHLAKRQIRTSGEDGDQLATWGLILGYVFTALILLSCCGWIALVALAGSDGGMRY